MGLNLFAYTPWGEATVLVFLGPIAVLGTGWLLTEGLNATSAIASVAMGSIAAAALAVSAMAWHEDALWPLAAFVFAPAVVRLYGDFARCPDGLAYNGILFRTFRMCIGFAAIPSLSAIASKWVVLQPLGHTLTHNTTLPSDRYNNHSGTGILREG